MVMNAARRYGRYEESRKFVDDVILKRASRDVDRLMGMFIQDIPAPNMRRRKEGVEVRHPLDLIDTNMHESYRIDNSMNSDIDRKSSWFSLKRAGSIASSFTSRKSSIRSYRSIWSTNTATSTASSYIRKNSGNFDGGNTRRARRRSENHKRSNAREACSTNEREQAIAEYCRELTLLDDSHSSSSSSDDEENTKPKISLDEVSNRTKVEEYVMKHSIIEHDIDDVSESIDKTRTRNNTVIAETSSGNDTLLNKTSLDNDTLINKIPMERAFSHKIKSTQLHLRNINDMLIDKRSSNEIKLPTCSKQIHTTKRLTDMLFDINRNEIKNKFDSLPNATYGRNLMQTKSHHLSLERNSRNGIYYNRVTANGSQKAVNALLSECSSSTDSINGSNRSLSTLSSYSNMSRTARHHSVPLNFIPGTYSPSNKRPRNRSLPISMSNTKKASFCFKGITCRVYPTTPRTNKALALAGCIGLVVGAPTSHKCQQ